MRAIILTMALGLALAGCKDGAAVTCPPLKSYPLAFQTALANETEAILKTAPHVGQALADYGLTRAAIRACIKRRK